ncbi:M23 family metallopeptidase [Kribbella endophytica]
MPQLPDAVWPLDPRPRIVHAYNPPAKPWLPGHRGIDLAGTPGQPVLAATNGTITYAGPVAGRSVVVITHGPQRTTYEPVIPSVPTGTTVHAAQPIGHLSAAASHCTPKTCLHWGLLEGKTYLNPLSLLPAQPVRLLPATPHHFDTPPQTPDHPGAPPPPLDAPQQTPDHPGPPPPRPDHISAPTPPAHRLLGQHPTTLLPAQRPQPQATCPPACQPPQPPNRADSPTAQPQAPTPQADTHSPLPTVFVALSALATLGATILIRNH